MARQRKAAKAKAAKASTDSEVEEIPRTLLDQLQSSTPFDINQLHRPLAEALSKSTKPGGVTFNEYNIPMGTPQRLRPEKTLVDQIDPEEDEDAIEPIGDAGQTFFFSVPLTMLLCVFYILIQKQYLEEPKYSHAFIRSAQSFIPIWFVLYLTHPRRHWVTVQFVFFATAVSAGCWTIYNVNQNGYYAVMRMVPPLGIMLVYSVIEMELIPAAISLICIVSYLQYKGFGVT
ncbi:hypothetical protein DRE_01769 [Drechslerella stenobrocha 248]|uniref:DUF7719 domain-containing protein n=1 Tax=Drechslerella stenobrocha 248 TaxID=1043628 RepID=W7I913_9PEZI|nr:hypothetical protein DRE_01769 [Drechslerella stenobrocha 248]